jgi:CRP-like cAMP-binding protein
MERSLRHHGEWTHALPLPVSSRLERTVTPSRHPRKTPSRGHSVADQELQALLGLPLFEGLDFGLLERLARQCTLQAFSKNQEVAGATDMAWGFHFLVAGHAKVQLETPGGRKKVVEIVGPGSNFDECMPVQAPGQNLRVIAVGATRVLSVSREVMLAELQAYPALAMRFIHSMSKRMGQLLVELNSHVSDNAMQRFVRYIANQLVPGDAAAVSDCVTVTLPAGKAIVASRLSLSPEYFSRMLRQLETENLIAVEHRNIVIPSLQRLVAAHGPQYA